MFRVASFFEHGVFAALRVVTRVGLSRGMVPRVLHVAWVSDLLEALRHAVLICSAVSFPCRLSAFLPCSDAELEALMI